MDFPKYSPSGKRTVPFEGPEDAELLVVAESPAGRECEAGRPLVGRAGRIWDKVLAKAGLERGRIRIVNAVPVRAPKDKFLLHSREDMEWGREMLEREINRAIKNGVKLIMPMGNNPLGWICPTLPEPPRWNDDESKQSSAGERSRIGVWRGSLFQLCNPMDSLENYERSMEGDKYGVTYVLPTYHPSAIQYRMDWNPWIVKDFQKAKKFLDGKWVWPKKREWFVNRYDLLEGVYETAFAEEVVAIDTESSPYKIISLATRDEVHTFAWDDERCRDVITRLLRTNKILKIAQNAGHDWTFFHLLGIKVELPHFDVGGGHHIIHGGSLARNLSPALTTWWTSYPYHKWLVDHDPKIYCGYDTCTAYDIWLAQVPELQRRKLWPVVEHDHQLLHDLLDMQWHGVKVDEEKRRCAEVAIEAEVMVARAKFNAMAVPVVKRCLEKFEKPHLFFKEKRCKCCGGGKVGKEHCWRCSGLEEKPKRKEDYHWLWQVSPRGKGVAAFEKTTIPKLKQLMPKCEKCEATGKQGHWQFEKMVSSDDQLIDILYKGFKLPKRYYRRKVTVRAVQLATLLETPNLREEQYEIVRRVLAFSEVKSNLTTMERLRPGVDGLLHSVFDPWGTGSGRTASKEGLLQVGTNLQNIPVKHRYVLVPRFKKLFVAPDYSQIETRNVAVVADDAKMRSAFTVPINRPGHPKHGKCDSHTVLQLAALDLAGITVTRDQCKVWGFGGMYGGQGNQLAIGMTLREFGKKDVVVSAKDGQTLVDLLLQVIWPGLQKWHRDTRVALRGHGELRSPTGRLRKWRGYILDKRGEVLQKIVNEGLSFFPQDMGAWVLALGLRNIRKELRKLVTPCIHVHDELVLEIPESPGRLVDEALEGIVRCMTISQWGMEYPIEEPVPLSGWREAKD